MTVVAPPPSFANINRPAWGSGTNGSINHDEVRSMFAPRKTIQRTSSSSSLASNASVSSTASSSTLVSSNGSANGAPPGTTTPVGDTNGFPITTLRKRPPQKAQWSSNRPADGQSDYMRGAAGGQTAGAGLNGAPPMHPSTPYNPGQPGSGASNGVMARGTGDPAAPTSQPVLYLVSLNGTFDRKTITVPYHPETLRIGRQTNKNTMPSTVNGFFDSKVLSRQHAEIWADRQGGKIWIRDIKSSNGTFVNGTRLSAENRESEPHELQTNDHLELGIDIVSEDQKSVVHHKVAAKVEHAGFINASSNLLDMNFGDLDPAGNAMMGSQMNGMQYGRTGSQSAQGTAGRMAPSANNAQANALAPQRGMWFTGPGTEAIVKKINQEMRNAKQQSNDLLRTQEFLKALLSKDDIRNEAKRDEANGTRAQLVNGANAMPFRPDNLKARFSNPPAPPPQQPLPEKPDVPSLKRGSTERPRSIPSTSSPNRQDAAGNATHLADALASAKKDLDTEQSRVRELQDKLHREEEARRTAEELARKLEAASVAAAAVAPAEAHVNGVAKTPAGQVAALEAAFALPTDETAAVSGATVVPATPASDDALLIGEKGSAEESAVYKARIDSLVTEMEGMKVQLEEFRKRAEKAEAERDADRETLAQMVQRIRDRDEQDAKAAAAAASAATSVATPPAEPISAAHAAQTISRSFSKGRKVSDTTLMALRGVAAAGQEPRSVGATRESNNATTGAGKGAQAAEAQDPSEEQFVLSRANTITPANSALAKKADRDRMVLQGVPYASMMGVVLLGVGLMAYLNGWQPQPPRLDR